MEGQKAPELSRKRNWVLNSAVILIGDYSCILCARKILKTILNQKQANDLWFKYKSNCFHHDRMFYTQVALPNTPPASLSFHYAVDKELCLPDECEWELGEGRHFCCWFACGCDSKASHHDPWDQGTVIPRASGPRSPHTSITGHQRHLGPSVFPPKL